MFSDIICFNCRIYLNIIENRMKHSKMFLKQHLKDSDSDFGAKNNLFSGLDQLEETGQEINKVMKEGSEEQKCQIYIQSRRSNLESMNSKDIDNLKETSIKDRIISTEENLFSIPSQTRTISSKKTSTENCSIKFSSQNLLHKAKILQSTKKKKSRKKVTTLKKVVSSQKVNNLTQNFTEKLKRNNIYSSVVDYNPFDSTSEGSLSNKRGIKLPTVLDKIFDLLSILQMIVMTFIFTVAIIYSEVDQTDVMEIVEMVGLISYCIEVVLNLLCARTVLGTKLEKLGDIFRNYLRSYLVIDLLIICVLIVDITFAWKFTKFARLLIVFKMPQCLEKIQKLEVYLIQNYYREQYWSLAKVLIFNFCFAHVLAILLGAMAGFDSSRNWMVTRQINDSAWYEKYMWSYYWGSTIMLTVGFGDIVPTTAKEALCIVIIQTFSCIILAYNINCVGTLISNIRAQDIERSRNYKTFKKLSDSNQISEDLTEKINNFIEESVNIKKNFNIQEENKFVNILPAGFKKQYLKESNKTIFKNIFYFKSLIEKTLFNLAQKIEISVAHPLEVLQPINDHSFNLIILKSGGISYCCKRNNHFSNNKIIDIMKIKENENCFLVNLNFISKNQPNYEVKSIGFSVICTLQFEKLINILRESQMDFQLYSYLKDKNKNILDEFEVFPCSFCKTRHTKFTCPKLHFIPISQHVIYKYLKKVKIGKAKRQLMERNQIKKHNPLKIFKRMKEGGSLYDLQKNQRLLPFVPSQEKVQKISFTAAKLLRINANFFIRRLRDETRPEDLKPTRNNELEELKNLLLLNTTEAVRQQFQLQNKEEMCEDEVWILKSDQMKNYKGYFNQNNACDLEECIQERLKNKQYKIQTADYEHLEFNNDDYVVEGNQESTVTENYMATLESSSGKYESEIFSKQSS